MGCTLIERPACVCRRRWGGEAMPGEWEGCLSIRFVSAMVCRFGKWGSGRLSGRMPSFRFVVSFRFVMGMQSFVSLGDR